MWTGQWRCFVPALLLAHCSVATAALHGRTAPGDEPVSGPQPFEGVAGFDTVANGTLTADTVWDGTVFVDGNVVVPGPFTLTILPGTVVRLTNLASVTATSGGQIDVQGSATARVSFERSATDFARWNELAATGSGSSLTIRHAILTRGRVRAASGALALLEDSELADAPGTSIIAGNSAALVTIRRCHVHDYDDIDLINTRTLAEDSLFERASSDIFELQNSPAGSVLRRCTFRDALNPNSDGVDMNGCNDVLIDSCRIYNVSDKGISSGSALSANDPTTFGLVVTNTLIFHAHTAIGIKDSGTAALLGNTIAAVEDGISVYAKFTGEGGHVTNGVDNLIWGVTNAAVRATSGGTVHLTFSNVQGTNFPGLGNISAAPLWRDAAAHDFRLLPGSPCLAASQDGRDIGVVHPIGGLPATPRILHAALENGGMVSVTWLPAAGARLFTLERSVDGSLFSSIATVPVSQTNFTDVPGPTGTNLYRLLASNFVGDSFPSEVVAATGPADRDGDGMPDEWELAHGLDPDVDDGSADPDGDRMTNLEEYLAGTNPQDRASSLNLTIQRDVEGRSVLAIETVAGRSYTIQTRSNFSGAAWANWLPISPHPANRTVLVTNSVTGEQLFFRVAIP